MDVQESTALCDRLAAAAAGRELAALLDGLDVRALSGAEAAAVLVAQRRQASHYTAGSLDVMIELGLRDEHAGPGMRREAPGEFAAEEPRALLCLTKAAAESEFWTGWALQDEFPAVMMEFRAGRLDWPRARLFPEVLLNLTPAQIDVITVRVLPEAAGLTTGRLRARLQREAMAIDPTWWGRRYREQTRNRRVEKHLNGDGTAELHGRDLPFDEVTQSMANLTRLAKAAKKAGDPRPLDTIRADLYTGFLSGTYQQADEAAIVTDLLLRAATETEAEHASAAGAHHNPTSTKTDRDRAADRTAQGAADDDEVGLIGEDDVAPQQRPEPSDAVPDDLEPRGGRVPLPRHRTAESRARAGAFPTAGGRAGAGASPATGVSAGAGVRVGAGVEIRIELGTLLGWDEHPAEIAGTGPVAAEVARKMVARQTRGHWRYARCDTDGHLIDTGPIHTRPSGWLDFAGPITGGIVEIAFTDPQLQAAQAKTHARTPRAPRGATSRGAASSGASRSATSRSATSRGAPSRSAASRGAASGCATSGARASDTAPGAEAWAPVLAALARRVGAGLGVGAGVGGDGDDPRRRLPREGLRRRVQVRFRTCVAPGCRRPAAECDIDHRREYARDGATVEANLQPLCRWHHRMKHVAGWELTALDAHTFRWTTPNGNTIDVRPPPVIADLPEPAPRTVPEPAPRTHP